MSIFICGYQIDLNPLSSHCASLPTIAIALIAQQIQKAFPQTKIFLETKITPTDRRRSHRQKAFLLAKSVPTNRAFPQTKSGPTSKKCSHRQKAFPQTKSVLTDRHVWFQFDLPSGIEELCFPDFATWSKSYNVSFLCH